MAALASQATALKAKGNEQFAHGKFSESEESYTSAIALDPSQEALWSNRAATRLKLGRPLEALSDAEECIKLNPTFLKGYHRKALALKDLGDDTAVRRRESPRSSHF